MILRHKFTESKLETEDTLLYYKNRINKSYSRIEQGNVINLYYLKDTPIDIARANIIYENKGANKNWLLLFLDMGVEYFNCVISEEPLEVRFQEKTFEMAPIESSYGTSYSDWFILCLMSILLRAKERQEELLQFKIK